MTLRAPSRATSVLTLGTVVLVATTLLAQQLQPAKPAHEAIGKLVCQMIEREHISRAPIDDKISARLVEKFIQTLDPEKKYFLASDVDEAQQQKTALDDLLKVGNLDFAFKTFETFLKRLDARLALADQLIDAAHDFTLKEEVPTDPKTIPWATTEDELNERWRKRIKYDLLLFKLDKTEPAEAKERLHKRYRNIKRTMHQFDSEDLVEMYLTALAQCFDPHSSYMSPRSERDFQIQMQLSLDGIGAALRGEDGYTIVDQIVPGGAAALDGRLKVKDKIVGVGQGDEEIVDVVDMKLSNVVNMIRGKRSTVVRLRVIPADGGETKVIDLVRQKIELKSSEVKGEIINAQDRIQGARGRVGVIHIPSFYRDFGGAQSGVEDFKSTARDVKAVLRDFAAKGGVDAIVVDLRYNGGGALSEAIEVSGLFIDEGPVVQVKDQRGTVRAYDDDDPAVAYTGPLIVVCNRLSASASEIFAGVIRDYRRGIVMGDTTTHGKGTVQSVMNVGKQMFQLFNPPERGALKLTINQFYRVNGDSTQNLGVPSDVVLPSILDHMDLGESSLENALAFDRIPAAEHKVLNLVTPSIVSSLRDRSRRRIAANAEFQRIERDVQRYLERKKRNAVSLNEEELLKERLEEEEKTKKKAEDSDDMNGNGPIFPDDDYNDEIIAVALDYVIALRGPNTAKANGR